MGYKLIRSETDGAVTTLTLARPESLNALSLDMLAELTDAIDRALAAGTRAFVLTGEGRGFCAGADLKAAKARTDTTPMDPGAVLETIYNPFVRKLYDLPVPLVTAINGPAVGGGLGLALSSDIAVMSKSAYLLMSFVNIALAPDAGATWLVASCVGRARAMRMAMMAEKVYADEALAMGLVAYVTEDGEVLERAQEIAARFAAGPTQTLGLVKRQVNATVEMSFDDSLAAECDTQGICAVSEDYREAVTAFVEKRKPVFAGR